ncbi:pleckstrin homology and RhoGEF domain containing G5 [Homo sapiens]|uniref:Pleckstrin homology and RhoGEF domain containing G5 n=1 Tax=Homo sapiens TaxID=9606 RepID=A0A6Q8PHD3_HUMAN|nr:pleckstrin-likey and RhoGEF domain containing G5 [Homo sapiens]KAI4078408.1 pleckstrin homology and RhoGEF domain containing G5 [Homo sapiens]
MDKGRAAKMGKLRLTQGQTARKWESWDLNPVPRYVTTPTASSCTAGGPSTSARPVTASSTAPCIMMGMSASTFPHKALCWPGTCPPGHARRAPAPQWTWRRRRRRALWMAKGTGRAQA